MWNPANFDLLQEFSCFSCNVSKMLCILSYGFLFICVGNKSIWSFSFKNYELEEKHTFHTESLSELIYITNLNGAEAIATGSYDSTIQLWTWNKENLEFIIKLEGEKLKIDQMSFINPKKNSLKNGILIRLKFFSIVEIWNLDNMQLIWKIPNQQNNKIYSFIFISPLFLSSDFQQGVIVLLGKVIQFWEFGKKQIIHSIYGSLLVSSIDEISSKSQKYIMLTSQYSTAIIDEKLNYIKSIPVHKLITININGSALLIGSSGPQILLYEIDERTVSIINKFEGNIYCLQKIQTKENNIILTAYEHCNIRAFNLKTRETIFDYNKHFHPISQIECYQFGQNYVICSADKEGVIEFYDLRGNNLFSIEEENEDFKMFKLLKKKDVQYILAYYDGIIKVWQVACFQTVKILRGKFKNFILQELGK